MNVSLKKEITGIKKEVIRHEGDPLTVKKALLMALILPNPDAKGTTAEDALKTRKLFDRLDEAEDEISLSAEEIVKLKEIVAKRLSELVAGSVILALEGE
jgi:hypothetical protein